MILSTLLLFSFVLAASMALIYFRAARHCLSALREASPAVWRSLGTPSLGWDSDPKSSTRFVVFLAKGDFSSLPPVAANTARIARRRLFASAVSGAMLLAIAVSVGVTAS